MFIIKVEVALGSMTWPWECGWVYLSLFGGPGDKFRLTCTQVFSDFNSSHVKLAIFKTVTTGHKIVALESFVE